MRFLMHPSLRLTLLPPKALIREETGKLINENTDRPALDTCAMALDATINNAMRNTLLRISERARSSYRRVYLRERSRPR